MNHADWRTTTGAGEFLAEAGPGLRADPVENTLLLTIAHAAQDSPPAAANAPLFGWHPGGGVFVHTPGFPVLLGPMTEAAAAGLAATLRRQGRTLGGVNGAPAAARAFAGQWQQAAGAASATRLFQRQRLFRLTGLTPPPLPPGRARLATASDREFLVQWTDAFHREAGQSGRSDSGLMVDSRLAYGGQLVWETTSQSGAPGEPGEPVSTAARTPVIAGMARVAPVYTPPGQRGKGYGGAVTVAVSQAAQQAGAREVVLFTDLANPASNALYQRLGYRPVSDRHLLLFTSTTDAITP